MVRAVWYEEQGGADVLRCGNMEKPSPQAGEVLVRVRASGVNPSDVKTRAGLRGGMAFARQIPHSDGAGVVADVGRGVSRERVGERVWLWNAAFGRERGTCAEYVSLPQRMAVAMGAQTTFAEGACFGVPVMTAVYAVAVAGGGGGRGRASLAGKTVLVTGGAGSVGCYAVQVAKLLGARVAATVSGAAKAKIARAAGADCVINYKKEDAAARVLALTDGAGADIAAEVEFGGNMQTTLRAMKPGGVVAAYGSMASPEPALPFYAMMYKNIALKMFLIYGVGEGERRRTLRLIRELEPGLRHRIAAELPLSQVRRAHRLAEGGKKVVVVVGG